MSIYSFPRDLERLMAKHKPYIIEARKNPMVTDLNMEYFRTMWGKEVFLPSTLVGISNSGEKIQLDLDCATIKVKGTKNVVKTQLSERKGSVKEVFAVDDYTIDIKGVLIGHDGVLPCSQVQWLRDMYESKNRIDLHNALTAYFLQEQKNVVITALNFYDQEAKDERHIPFSMTLISDYVETLEFV